MKTLEKIKSAISVSFARVLHTEEDAREVRLNHDTGLIKIIACLLMLSDHMGKMIFPHAWRLSAAGDWANVFPSDNIMRVIGRLAMPLFCYGIAVGCRYTRNIWKYALRLFGLAILVHPLYMVAMGHVPMGAFDWAKNFYRLDRIYEFFFTRKLNILFTLGMGVALIACYRSKAYVLLVLVSLLAWHMQGVLDYGYRGVLLILIFYALLDRPLASFLAVALFMLNWAMPQLLVSGKARANTEIYALLALPLIYIPMKRRVKLPKWVFYAFYPGHLILIYLLQL